MKLKDIDMDNPTRSERKYTRRQLLGNVARLGAGAAALAILSPRGIKVVSAEVGQPEKTRVMIEDLTEETAADFARGQMQGSQVVGHGRNAVLQARAGGEFISGTLTLPFPVTHLGLHWKVRGTSPDALAIAVRAGQSERSWSEWQALNIEAIADLSTTEDAIPVHGHADISHSMSETGRYEVFASLAGFDNARMVQYRVTFPSGDSGLLESMTVTAINSTADTQQASTMEVAKQVTLQNDADIQIDVITREGWGADETLRFSNGEKLWTEMYVPTKKVFLHHTATSNNYSDGAAQVRAIYAYHAQTLGWGDIGYNILVDRFGNIYEGRHGRGDGSAREILGDDVVAGHVFAYNYGTTGIAAIGDSQQGTWNRSWGDVGLKAIEHAVAFECGRQYLDPEGASDFLRSDGIWHQGALRHCVGHRDADGSGGSTACPGTRLYSYLNDTLRDAVAARLIGASASTLTGTQDGSNLTFNWSGADVYSLEGWYKASGAHDVTYLSGYDKLESSEPRQAWDDTASNDGQQMFEVSHPGHYTMHVRAASNGFSYAEHLTFRVTEATEPPPAGTISGTVKDAYDTPIEGATVAVIGAGLSAISDAEGGYTIENVPADTYDVTASADGYQSSTEQGVEVGGDETVDLDFTLALVTRGTISGRVSDADGADISGATVLIEGTDLSATTDDVGTYTIADIPTGEYQVTASADDYQPETKSVPVVEGETTIVDFVLESKAEEIAESMHIAALDGHSNREGPTWTATVTIKVVDNLGSPVSGATVKGDWSGAYAGLGSATTDENGRCQMTTGNIPNRDQTVTFTVTGITNSLDYAPGDNAASTVTIMR
jgi:hypothetical protein